MRGREVFGMWRCNPKPGPRDYDGRPGFGLHIVWASGTI